MEQNQKPNPPQENRIQKIKKIRELLCKVIEMGTASEIKVFYRWFKKDLENSAWPVLKGPFRNISIDSSSEPVFALKGREDTDIYHAVLSLKPNMNAVDLNQDRITALHNAVLSDKIMPAAMFLYYGCDPNVRTRTNDRPIDKSRSEVMRQMFRDFEQLDRQVFAIKYKLNVPKEEEEEFIIGRFPFLDLPLDIQREVLLKLDPVDLLNAPLVCKNWKIWSLSRIREFIPKLGNWKIHEGSGEYVSFKIQLFPTCFHFCQDQNRYYTPLKKKDLILHLLSWRLPRFEDFMKANGSDEQKRQLDLLKRLIFQEEFPTYLWDNDYKRYYMFVQLTDDVGLGIKWTDPRL